MGHEGAGVNADVFINGVKCYHVLDDGNGGCLDFTLLAYGSKNPERIKALAKELNEYIATIPAKTMDFGHGEIKDDDGNVRLFPVTLEDYVNDLLYDYERQLSKKKMEKHMVNAILYGVPNGASYMMIKFVKPLSEIPIPYLQNKVNCIKRDECKDGVVILNTNLEALSIKL